MAEEWINTYLPPNYAELPELSLSRLGLESIPDEVFHANVQATKVDLSFNQLSVLPNTITLLPNIQELWVNNNTLTSLPNELGNLLSLTRLSVDHNTLVSLPDFQPGNQLMIVDTAFNQLESLPESISNLSNLYMLFAQQNNLSEIPTCIDTLPYLQILDFTGNPNLNTENFSHRFSHVREMWCDPPN